MRSRPACDGSPPASVDEPARPTRIGPVGLTGTVHADPAATGSPSTAGPSGHEPPAAQAPVSADSSSPSCTRAVPVADASSPRLRPARGRPARAPPPRPRPRRLGRRPVARRSARADVVARASHARPRSWPLRQPRVGRRASDVAAGFDPPATTAWGAPATAGSTCSGTPVSRCQPSLAGTVTFAGRLAGRGVVVVDHGGVRTTYEPVTATRPRGGDVGRRGTGHRPPRSCSAATASRAPACTGG